MFFEAPGAFSILLFLLFLVYFHSVKTPSSSFLFSSTAQVRKAGRSLRQKLSFLPFLLRLAVMILLVVSIARPQEGKEQIRDTSKGIAIYCVMDCSGSMAAEMSYNKEQLNRLEVVKKVFMEFIDGNGKDLPGRPNDLIGMISFARHPETVCPLTLSRGALAQFLKNIQIVKLQTEDGTAIGDAIALGAARLKTAEESLAYQIKEEKGKYTIKSKIMILLTDGENNCGKREPQEAAQMAKEWGIKIYIIGIGGGESFMTIATPFGNQKIPVRSSMDEASLKKIAESTGGIYKMANDADSLKAIYQEIDRLEKSEVESIRYMDYQEMFSAYTLAALGILVLEVLLSCTVFRRIP